MCELLSQIPTSNDAIGALKAVLESNFVTALVGSVAGAFGGAWAAQRIAERSKLRAELLNEIQQANAAASMAYGVANAHLGLKRQFVKGLREDYLEEQKRFGLFQEAVRAGKVPSRQPFHLDANLHTIQSPLSPTEAMQRLVFDRLSVSAPTLFLMPMLLASIHSLKDCLEARNALVEKWEDARPADLPFLYLGLEVGSTVDRRYQMLVEAIYSQTDDVIAFSSMIADDLHRQALRLRSEFRRRFRSDGPLVSKVDLSRFEDIMPLQADYKNFHAMFDAIKSEKQDNSSLLRKLFKFVRVRTVPAGSAKV